MQVGVGLLISSLLLACGGERERVTAREQRELPAEAYGLIANLCSRGDSSVDRENARREVPRARRQFIALERSLRRHPDAVVQVEYTLADSPEVERRDQTVRELAETHLERADGGVGGPQEARCYRAWHARLERALQRAE
jgi:hypothetical protein